MRCRQDHSHFSQSQHFRAKALEVAPTSVGTFFFNVPSAAKKPIANLQWIGPLVARSEVKAAPNPFRSRLQLHWEPQHEKMPVNLSSRAILRQSRFLLRKNNLRPASTTSEAATKAKETASGTASKASEG